MSTQEFLIPARPDLAAAREGWLRALARERRLAELTVEAYERDTRQFLHFLTGHCGGEVGAGRDEEFLRGHVAPTLRQLG